MNLVVKLDSHVVTNYFIRHNIALFYFIYLVFLSFLKVSVKQKSNGSFFVFSFSSIPRFCATRERSNDCFFESHSEI